MPQGKFPIRVLIEPLLGLLQVGDDVMVNRVDGLAWLVNVGKSRIDGVITNGDGAKRPYQQEIGVCPEHLHFANGIVFASWRGARHGLNVLNSQVAAVYDVVHLLPHLLCVVVVLEVSSGV